MIDDRAGTLVADCANCVGLCCVALAFARSEDFAFDKDAGEECRNLEPDYRCRIHPSLRTSGMKGCTIFDCHGAGQRVTRSSLTSASWRESPAAADSMFAVFRVVRQLHEMLWYLAVAARSSTEHALSAQIERVYAEIDELSGMPGDRVLAADLEVLRNAVNPLLLSVSESVRTAAIARRSAPLPKRLRAGADAIGATFVNQDLRGADLRGALLIAADLSGSDLRNSDLLAADLRDANLCGADLSTALFVTQMQLNGTRGDADTRIPTGSVRPSHWASR